MKSTPNFIWKDLFRKGKEAQGSLIQALSDNILFETLSNSELRSLSNVVYERVYEPNEPIFHQGDRGFGMYVISKGKVAIKSHPSPEEEVLVTTLGTGSFFGELSLVEPDNVRSASAISMERSHIIGFFKPDLMEILERKPNMGVKILFQLAGVLGQRLVETTDLLSEASQAHENYRP